MSLVEEVPGIDLKPKIVVRWGETINGQILTKGSIWYRNHEQAVPVPILLDGLRDKEVGSTLFGSNEYGVVAYPTIVDIAHAFRHAHVLNFDVRWKPLVIADETRIIDAGVYITRAHISQLNLVPKTMAFTSANIDLRVMEAGA